MKRRWILVGLLLLASAGGALAHEESEVDGIPIIFKPQPPLSDPASHYPGFQPGETILKKGSVSEPGRMPLPVDMLYDRDVAITLRDGTVIYADIYRPTGTAHVPAILSYGPAGKRGQNNMLDNFGGKGGIPPRLGIPRDATSGYQAWEASDPAHWVRHGYAIVNVDPRGVYMSQGNLHIFGPSVADDGYDIVEALARQPWSNGRIGMAGNSWYAMTQYLVASRRPPHLAAIAPWEGEDDIYRDEYVRDGIPEQHFYNRAFGAGLLEDMGAMVQHYPLKNAYWDSKLFDIEAIRVPTYLVGSYSSQIHSLGTLRVFGRLRTPERWLRVHDTNEWYDFYQPDKEADLRRFFDRYLKGINNGWEHTPRVRLSVLDPGGKDTVGRPESAFPLPREQRRRLFLDARTASLAPARPQDAASAAYQTGGPDAKTSFTLAFDRDTEITGFITLHLWVEARGADDMDLFARIEKTDGAGQPLYQNAISYRYSGPDGRLRVSERAPDPVRSGDGHVYHLHLRKDMLKPGEIVPVDIQFWPTGLVFHKGQQLRLTIAGYDYMPSRPEDRPMADVHNTGTHVIYTGGLHASYLSVPFIPAKGR